MLDRNTLRELIEELKEDYPMDELLEDLSDFKRGLVVGRILLIQALELKLDEDDFNGLLA